jgi:hypothetical protein
VLYRGGIGNNISQESDYQETGGMRTRRMGYAKPPIQNLLLRRNGHLSEQTQMYLSTPVKCRSGDWQEAGLEMWGRQTQQGGQRGDVGGGTADDMEARKKSY